MVQTVNIHHAKTHLSRLLASVAEGEEVIIAKNGTPLARLISVEDRKPRKPGRFLGQIPRPEALLDSSPDGELDLWSQGHLNDPVSAVPSGRTKPKAKAKSKR